MTASTWQCQSTTGICPMSRKTCPTVRGPQTVLESIRAAERAQRITGRDRLGQQTVETNHGGTE